MYWAGRAWASRQALDRDGREVAADSRDLRAHKRLLRRRADRSDGAIAPDGRRSFRARAATRSSSSSICGAASFRNWAPARQSRDHLRRRSPASRRREHPRAGMAATAAAIRASPARRLEVDGAQRPGSTPIGATGAHAGRALSLEQFEILAFTTGTRSSRSTPFPQPRRIASCATSLEQTSATSFRRCAHLDRHGFTQVEVRPGRAGFSRRAGSILGSLGWLRRALDRADTRAPTILPNLGGSLPNESLPTCCAQDDLGAHPMRCSQHAPDEHCWRRSREGWLHGDFRESRGDVLTSDAAPNDRASHRPGIRVHEQSAKASAGSRRGRLRHGSRPTQRPRESIRLADRRRTRTRRPLLGM